MALISKNCIENIKQKVSLYEVVSPYVSLKRVGKNWQGLSPFNSEKTPSFYILSDKNLFKCFSSGYAGDVFRFIELKENLSFNEAVQSIAEQFNVPLEYENASSPTRLTITPSLKKEILDIHEVAAHFFHEQFMNHPQWKNYIQDYWIKERKFSLECAKNNLIGIAPPKDTSLLQLLLKKNHSQEALQKCGLFYESKYTLPLMPRFQGRLMIPLRDAQGRIIAFAGRALPITPQSDPAVKAKYINSPNTLIFNKSHCLFGLDTARKSINSNSPNTPFFIVEGQLDVLRCQEKGFKNTVAPQGTSINETQLAILRRYTSTLICILDGDTAGQKAAIRTASLALKSGLDIHFVTLPNHTDPDALLQTEQGTQLFKTLLEKKQPLIPFLLNAFDNGEGSPPLNKTHLIYRIFQIIACSNSQIVKEDCLQQISYLTHTPYEAIKTDFQKFSYHPHTPATSSLSTISEKNKLTSVEYQLLMLILHYDFIAYSLANVIDLEWISSHSTASILLQRILSNIKEDCWNGPDDIKQLLDNNETSNLVYSILSEEPQFEDPHPIANLCLKHLYKNFLNAKKTSIERILSTLPLENKAKIHALQKERIHLRKLSQNPPHI